jgi:peptidoglycan/LPS O-acetylase OafA/YrhL
MPNVPIIDTKRIPALDGVRGIAFLMVFSTHLCILGTGHFGVDLFFVLSGFLITSILLQEHQRFGSINLYKFYLRRALRLLPALFLVLMGILLYTAIMLPFPKLMMALSDTWRIILYVWNWVLAAGWNVTGDVSYIVEHHQVMYLHLWSLSVEEQFYIIWPFLLLFLLKLPRKQILVFLGIGIIIPAIARFHYWQGGPALWIYFRTDFRFDNLLYGATIAWFLNWGMVPQGRNKTLLSWAGMLAFVGLIGLAIPDLINNGKIYQGLLSLVALFSAILIASAVYCPLAPLKWLLEMKPLRWIGRVSYGLYLWHLPIIVMVSHRNIANPFIKDFIVIVATFSISAISYYKFELPFLKLKEKIGHVNQVSTGDTLWNSLAKMLREFATFRRSRNASN